MSSSSPNQCLYNDGPASLSGANASNCYRSGYYNQHYWTSYNSHLLLKSHQIIYNNEHHKRISLPDSSFDNSGKYNNIYSPQVQEHFTDSYQKNDLSFSSHHNTQRYYANSPESSYTEQNFQDALYSLKLLYSYSFTSDAFYSNQMLSNPHRENNSDDHNEMNAQFIFKSTVELSCQQCQTQRSTVCQ